MKNMSPENKPIAQDREGSEKDPVRAPGRLVDENGVVLTQEESKQEMEDRLDGGWRDGLK